MAQYRVWYAVYAPAIAPESTTSYVPLRGVQSIGVNTSFSLEALFELGMAAVYQQLEMEPNVEITMEKFLDGHPLIGHHATRGATSATIVGRSSRRCNVALSIHTDTQDAASGTALTVCSMSGQFLQQWQFRFPVEGPFTESCTLVGNSKVWDTSAPFDWTANYTPTGVPLAAEGVNFRQHFDWDTTRLPTNVYGISASGTNDKTGDIYGAHVQSITTGITLGRDSLFELGRKGPYYRFPNFPAEATTEISQIATLGDQVDAAAEATNLTNETIIIKTTEGTKINLGSKNKLLSVTQQGGNAGQGGGNVMVTYNFRTYSEFSVTHPQDPTSALAE